MRFSSLQHVAVLTVSPVSFVYVDLYDAIACREVLSWRPRPAARAARAAGRRPASHMVARVTRCCILILSVVSVLGIESFDMT